MSEIIKSQDIMGIYYGMLHLNYLRNRLQRLDMSLDSRPPGIKLNFLLFSLTFSLNMLIFIPYFVGSVKKGVWELWKILE